MIGGAAGADAADSADVIVIGLGAMGVATAFQLADRGVSVIGVDRFTPPHAHGSSHGETRITRLAIGEGPQYVPLVRRSHALWRELEERTGVPLMRTCGGLVLGAPDVDGFLARTRASATACEIAHQALSAQQIREHFPMFEIGPQIEGYHEPDAGYLVPERAISVQLNLARMAGATLLFGEVVRSWSSTNGGGVTVRTDASTLRAGRLVLCAGAWIAGLVPELSDVFTVYRQVLHWFPIREGYRRFAEMPVFIWDLGQARDGNSHPPSLYGFPAINGPDGGVKIGFESYEHPLGPGAGRRGAGPAEALDAHERLIAPNIPWLGAPALRSASCLYTSTESGDFVIDRHPVHESVVIVSPCSGHGFKHSAAIGEAVAQLIVDGAPTVDLTPFRLPSPADRRRSD